MNFYERLENLHNLLVEGLLFSIFLLNLPILLMHCFPNQVIIQFLNVVDNVLNFNMFYKQLKT